jgi:hypothetical protein
MIRKEQLAAGMMHECDVCLHLFGKLSPEAYDYRPSPHQRTTTELLQYLAICGIAGMECMAARDWKRFGEFRARTHDMRPEDFPAFMQRQKAEIREFFAAMTEDRLETQEAPLPGGGTLPLGAAILNGPFKWIAGYKLQLFLYAKATGASDIGTANAWAGMDWRG